MGGAASLRVLAAGIPEQRGLFEELVEKVVVVPTVILFIPIYTNLFTLDGADFLDFRRDRSKPSPSSLRI